MGPLLGRRDDCRSSHCDRNCATRSAVGGGYFVGSVHRIFGYSGRALSGATGRESLLQREFFNVLWLAIALAFFVNVAVFRVFPGLASAGIWSFSETLVLLYIGLHGNRRAIVCAVLVMASMVLANFGPAHLSAYILAGGMIAGYSGFGLAELLSKE